MEKLDKVIEAAERCSPKGCWEECPYYKSKDCEGSLRKDILEMLKEQNRLIRELSDNIPCCDNCEGKTTLGERTDKCVYEIEGFDSVIYCAKRGIENCFGYRKKIDALTEDLTGAQNEIHALLKKQDILRSELAEERERSARWLRESEPVVHAHWVIEKRHSVSKNPYMDDNYHIHASCSNCGFIVDSRNLSFGYADLKTTKFCSECGAHMDEEVAE